jgi:hypothetical protein
MKDPLLLCFKHQWASLFSESGRDPYIPVTDTRKCYSLLGLNCLCQTSSKLVKQVCPQEKKKKTVKGTETSKVNWLSRICSLPSGKRKKTKQNKKQLKG